MRIGLTRLQYEVLGRIRAEGAVPAIPLNRDSVAFHPILLERLLVDLVTLLKSMNAGHPQLDRIVANPGILAGFSEIARHAAFEPQSAFLEDAARRLELPLDTVCWLGRMLAAPFVTAAVRRVPERGRSSERTSPGCPFCSAPPGLAYLRRADGRRMLVCGLCGEPWCSIRTACPFCASAGRWMRLASDEDTVRWVETCDGCHGYLKTIDERQFPEGESVAPLAESVRTLLLDLAAEKWSCRPNLPYAAMT